MNKNCFGYQSTKCSERNMMNCQCIWLNNNHDSVSALWGPIRRVFSFINDAFCHLIRWLVLGDTNVWLMDTWWLLSEYYIKCSHVPWRTTAGVMQRWKNLEAYATCKNENNKKAVFRSRDKGLGPRDHSSSVCESLALGLVTFAKSLGLALEEHFGQSWIFKTMTSRYMNEEQSEKNFRLVTIIV